MATFPEAPLYCRTAGFPVVRFEALAFLPWTFPNEMKFKCWCTYAPSSLGLTTASTHLLAYGLGSVLCPTTVRTVSPPSAQSPFAPCRCDPHGGDAASVSSEDITPPSSLLRTHSPVAAASPRLRFMPSWEESSQVVTSPCCPLDLPDVISENLSLDAGSHTPAVPQRALACFFRCVIGLPHKELGRLPASCPLETTSCGALISGRQIFLYVPASNFVLPPRLSLPLRILPQGSRGFYVRAERASFPPHAPDMLTVRFQAIDGTRTFTSLDPRPCRPLPPWSGSFPPQPPPAFSRSRSAASSVLYPCTTPRDRAYETYSSSLSPIGPPSPAAGGPGVSRFSRMEFLCMPGVFDFAGWRRTRHGARRLVAFRLS